MNRMPCLTLRYNQTGDQPRAGQWCVVNSDSIQNQRLELKAHFIRTFEKSRGSAGSRMIQSSLVNEGIRVDRYRIPSLMKEASLVCCQPGPHKYTIENRNISKCVIYFHKFLTYLSRLFLVRGYYLYMVWFTMDLPGGRNGPIRTAGCWLGAIG
jgi:hypothetical protein